MTASKKRGRSNFMKERGIGKNKLSSTTLNLVFKSKLMARQKNFLNEAIENARMQGQTSSTRITDRSFH